MSSFTQSLSVRLVFRPLKSEVKSRAMKAYPQWRSLLMIQTGGSCSCTRWLPREAVLSPFLKIFKNHLATALGNLLSVTLLEQGCCTRWSQEVPSNFNYSVFSFVVKILSYLPLLLRANADPSRSGFLSGHLILKDTSSYILLSCNVAYLFLQAFYNGGNNLNKIRLYRKGDFIPNSCLPNSNNLSLNRNSSQA